MENKNMIKINGRRGMALFQIVLLVSFSFAIAFVIGSGIVEVGAASEQGAAAFPQSAAQPQQQSGKNQNQKIGPKKDLSATPTATGTNLLVTTRLRVDPNLRTTASLLREYGVPITSLESTFQSSEIVGKLGAVEILNGNRFDIEGGTVEITQRGVTRSINSGRVVLADGQRYLQGFDNNGNSIGYVKVDEQTIRGLARGAVEGNPITAGIIETMTGVDKLEMQSELQSLIEGELNGWTPSERTEALTKFRGSKAYQKLNDNQRAQLEETISSDSLVEKPEDTGEGLLAGLFGSNPFGLKGAPAQLATGLIWGATAAAIGKMAGSFLGLDKDNSNALSLAAFGGVAVYRSLSQGLLGKEGFAYENAGLIGIGIGVAIFALMYKKKSQQVVEFQCLPWEPPLGGSKCEECNADAFRPCSEYRCKSLGQACELVNAGTEEEACTWVNPGDVNSPTIEPSIEALKPLGLLKYVPDTTIRPPNRGVKITDIRNTNGCLEPFTPLEFGVKVNEPAQCKIGFDRNNTFETMEYYFGENNLYRYNHTQKMRLPSPNEDLLGAGSPLLENDANMDLFVRCQDANGNVNEDAFIFTFCVDASPDTTPPIIEGTSIIENGAVQFNADKVPIDVYTNEPATCKWSRTSKGYDDMENAMTCNTNADAVNSDLQYTCSGELTGITNNAENKFYFRCQDTVGNTNVQSYPLTLRGSQELNIIDVSPEEGETVTGATSTVPVTLGVRTDDGADEGLALCYFSNTGTEGSYVPMFNTNSFEHTQELDLTNGNYNYYFRCVDAGGNSAEATVGFSVFVDTLAPNVVRVYKDLDALKIVTDEDAQCVYSLKDCNYVFDEGTALLYSNTDTKENHFAEWDTKNTYNIKCKDERGNEPSPNSCSIVVSAVNLV